MMLIPCGPRAVPTGGAGFVFPAGICSLTNPVTFFAMILLRTFLRGEQNCFALQLPRFRFDVVVVSDGALLAVDIQPPRARASTTPVPGTGYPVTGNRLPIQYPFNCN